MKIEPKLWLFLLYFAIKTFPIMRGKYYLKEELKMKVNVKHVVEIACGLVVGGLMNDALNKTVEVSKKVVENLKKKES